jgi:hypothetical protein
MLTAILEFFPDVGKKKRNCPVPGEQFPARVNSP